MLHIKDVKFQSNLYGIDQADIRFNGNQILKISRAKHGEGDKPTFLIIPFEISPCSCNISGIFTSLYLNYFKHFISNKCIILT